MPRPDATTATLASLPVVVAEAPTMSPPGATLSEGTTLNVRVNATAGIVRCELASTPVALTVTANGMPVATSPARFDPPADLVMLTVRANAAVGPQSEVRCFDRFEREVRGTFSTQP